MPTFPHKTRPACRYVYSEYLSPRDLFKEPIYTICVHKTYLFAEHTKQIRFLQLSVSCTLFRSNYYFLVAVSRHLYYVAIILLSSNVITLYFFAFESMANMSSFTTGSVTPFDLKMYFPSTVGQETNR